MSSSVAASRIDETAGIHLAERILSNARHICAFFHTKEEEYRVVLPFMREGLGRGEKVYNIIDPARHAAHEAALRGAGIDVMTAKGTGQLEIFDWAQAYLRDGRFDTQRMLALIKSVLDARGAQRFALSRLVANMEWALTDQPGVDELVEYEARLNYLLTQYSDPVVCAYDLNRFGAGTVMDMLRTHPAVIIGGVLYENPFYLPPDQFLRELKQRRA